MLKIVFIDDDESIVEGLNFILDWQALGIEVAGCAYSGKEGYDLILKEKPHLLITDIRMPQLDGLSMLDALKKHVPDMKIIILSGYDDFEYAQGAIEKGAFSYLLKPLRKNQLLEKIEAATKLIRENLSHAERQETLTLLAKEKYLLDLLKGTEKIHTKEDINTHLFPLSSVREFYEVMLIDCQEMPPSISPSLSLSTSLTPYLEKEGMEPLIPYESNKFIILLRGSCGSHLKQKRHKLIDFLNLNIGDFLAIGVSSISDNICLLNTLFEQALYALNETFYSSDNIVVFDKSTAPSYSEVIDARPYMEAILNHVKELNEPAATLQINGFFNYLVTQKKCPSNQIYIETISLLVYLKNLAYSFNLKESSFFSYDIYRVTYLRKHYKNYHELKSWVLTCTLELIHQLKATKTTSTDFLIEQIKAYVQEQNGLITREQTAQHFHIHASYLSRIFKQVTGISFIDYVTLVKLDRGKLLLLNSTLQIQEIAEELGYNNAQYFSTVFEKYVGLSPTRFRKQTKSH
ncbi:hypothetical protein CS063_16760 [Sporanaerobium hydrogeniformans]|uniref:Uncharacterized protein n=1 Tax=Sporanaerobium hydrogeniformans TaxID=3072179 RepID=A0AC61D8T8_9FIRM|nr:response regulator [Sporanaerobium hydrogeniformans]PHV69260.1 hypothetical protein CS063_16760 [Sporanaerobium hydrogeniformans]